MSWLKTARQIAAWVVIPAFLMILISEGLMRAIFPEGRPLWPSRVPPPKSFEIWLLIRSVSFLVALITGVFSLPQWQAVVGLILSLAWAVHYLSRFSAY